MAGSKAAARLAVIQRDIEINKWRFTTTESSAGKLRSAAALVALELKGYLVASFSRATRKPNNNPRLAFGWDWAETQRLKAAEVNAASTSPAKIVRRLLASRDAMNDWEKAKAANDFTLVQDSLQKLVDIRRAEAGKRAKLLGLSSPFEAILDFQTPGLRKQHFEAWERDLAVHNRQLLDRLKAQGHRMTPSGFSMEKAGQKKLEGYLLDKMGIEDGALEIGESAHPLCLGTHDDVRMGMRYDPQDYAVLILTALHEGGHALYRLNLPEQHKGRMTGLIAGAAIDEAMALIIENHAGRDPQFLDRLSSTLRKEFNTASLGNDALYERVTALSNVPVRTKSDEVRYPLDVILRYRLEKALFDENLLVKDLPQRWKKEFKTLTGMDVKNDNEGVLQDIHWFGGEFGWFPNYMIGQLAAAQLFEAACAADPNVKPSIAQGDIGPLREWLKKNIYGEGARLDPLILIQRASGKPLSTDAYKRHLQARYGSGAQPTGPTAANTPKQ